MIFYQNKQNGFSLVETLVAISILLIVIVGPMTITMSTAKSSTFASEQIQAFFLAQEGLELVQKLRDDLLLEGLNTGTDTWNTFTSYTQCYSASGCGFGWSETEGELIPPVSCATSSNCLIYRSEDGRGVFTHTAAGNIATPFTRRIYLEVDGAGVKVVSVVTWRTGSIVSEQQVEVDTYLYNIYEITT